MAPDPGWHNFCMRADIWGVFGLTLSLPLGFLLLLLCPMGVVEGRSCTKSGTPTGDGEVKACVLYFCCFLLRCLVFVLLAEMVISKSFRDWLAMNSWFLFLRCCCFCLCSCWYLWARVILFFTGDTRTGRCCGCCRRRFCASWRLSLASASSMSLCHPFLIWSDPGDRVLSGSEYSFLLSTNETNFNRCSKSSISARYACNLCSDNAMVVVGVGFPVREVSDGRSDATAMKVDVTSKKILRK